MWSLPDIKRLNDQAVREKSSLRRAARKLLDPETGKPATCRFESGCQNKCGGSIQATLVYDIFSDDPKEVLFSCEEHGYLTQSSDEGYFRCDDCGRTMVDHYTWERYVHVTDDGEVCLNCFAKQVIENDEEWIELTPESIEAVNFDRIRLAKHIIAVDGPRHDLEEVGDGVTLDASSGCEVIGLSHCASSPNSGVQGIKRLLNQARDEGHERALLVLDGAYQFAVHIGVYVEE